MALIRSVPGVICTSYSSNPPASGVEWKRQASRHSNFDLLQAVDFRVIGVVNSATLWKVDSVRLLVFYRAAMQDPGDFTLNIRTAVDPRSIKAAAEAAVRSLGHQYSLQTMTAEERLDSYTTVQRLTAMLALFFGGLGLLIAAVGPYGLLSFSSHQANDGKGDPSCSRAAIPDSLDNASAESSWFPLWAACWDERERRLSLVGC